MAWTASKAGFLGEIFASGVLWLSELLGINVQSNGHCAINSEVVRGVLKF